MSLIGLNNLIPQTMAWCPRRKDTDRRKCSPMKELAPERRCETRGREVSFRYLANCHWEISIIIISFTPGSEAQGSGGWKTKTQEERESKGKTCLLEAPMIVSNKIPPALLYPLSLIRKDER